MSTTSENGLFARGVLMTYVNQVVHLVSLLVFTPIILNGVGSVAYGVWVVLGSAMGYLRLANFGLNVAVARWSAEYDALGKHGALGPLVSTCFVFLLVAGFIVVVVAGIVAGFMEAWFTVPEELLSEARVACVVMGVSVAAYLIANVFGNTIFGLKRADIFKAYATIHNICNLALILILLHLGLGIVGLSFASLGSVVLLVWLYSHYLKRLAPQIKVRLSLVRVETVKEILPFSLRTFSLGVTQQVLYFSDNIVISTMLGVAAVTPYAVAHQLCFNTTLLFSAITTTMLPIFAAKYATNDIAYIRRGLVWLTRISLGIMSPFALLLLFLGPPFMSLWVGEANFPGMPVLIAMVVMSLLHAYGTAMAMLLQAIGRNRALANSEIINACLNLGLSIFLVQKFGILGAALGTLGAALATSIWVMSFVACRSIALPFRELITSAVLPPIGVGVGLLGILYVIREDLLGADSYVHLSGWSLLILSVYAILFWIVCLDGSERRTIVCQAGSLLRSRSTFPVPGSEEHTTGIRESGGDDLPGRESGTKG